MVFEQIEQLKQQYTDKYVVVDETRPELRRFKGQTGIVKTVNMSGRALVEFDANLNIGWYDIELDYLNVVDKPLEKEDAPKAKAKAPAAAAKPAAKKPGAMSVEEMLAAARANKTSAAAPAAKPAAAPAPAPEAKPAAAAKPAASMSVEEMLAAARANKAAPGAAVAATGAVAAGAAAASAATPAPAPAAAPAPTPEPEPAAAAPAGNLPTSIPEIIAYCRKTDGA